LAKNEYGIQALRYDPLVKLAIILSNLKVANPHIPIPHSQNSPSTKSGLFGSLKLICRGSAEVECTILATPINVMIMKM
jgi:hypothetical protein